MKQKSLHVKKAEEIQNEIYQEMSPEKKIKITSQLILLAKKIKESKSFSKNDTRTTSNKNS